MAPCYWPYQVHMSPLDSPACCTLPLLGLCSTISLLAQCRVPTRSSFHLEPNSVSSLTTVLPGSGCLAKIPGSHHVKIAVDYYKYWASLGHTRKGDCTFQYSVWSCTVQYGSHYYPWLFMAISNYLKLKKMKKISSSLAVTTCHYPHMARGYCTGEYKYKTFPSKYKLLLASGVLHYTLERGTA